MPNPACGLRSGLSEANRAYLDSVIPAELSQIVAETNSLHTEHSAFSQLALNQTVQHCCGLLNVPYSSQSNQSKKAETPHKQQICMDNIIDYFGIVRPATFGNHRGTHFLALECHQAPRDTWRRVRGERREISQVSERRTLVPNEDQSLAFIGSFIGSASRPTKTGHGSPVEIHTTSKLVCLSSK
jgi:hypothetical protein